MLSLNKICVQANHKNCYTCYLNHILIHKNLFDICNFSVLAVSNHTVETNIFSLKWFHWFFLTVYFSLHCLFKLVSAESIVCWFSIKQRAQNAEPTLLWLTESTSEKVNQIKKTVSGNRVDWFNLQHEWLYKVVLVAWRSLAGVSKPKSVIWNIRSNV